VETVDLKTYQGPLILWCTDCDSEQMTHVKYDSVEVKRDESDSVKFDVSMTGFRRCAQCQGANVCLRYIRVDVTISDSVP
jgi:hypothetical protein